VNLLADWLGIDGFAWPWLLLAIPLPLSCTSSPKCCASTEVRTLQCDAPLCLMMLLTASRRMRVVCT